MAFEVLDEYEQGEVVRKWIRENAASMVIGVLLGLALIFGWQQWKAHQARARLEAAAQFDAYSEAASAGRGDEASKIAMELREKYPDSAYAVFVAMRDASAAAEKNDLDAAGASLEWAVAHADNAQLKALANLGLARVRLAQEQPDAALKLLDRMPQDGFEAAVGELRGDILARLGQRDAARTAYEEALAILDPQAPARNIVQMKHDDLAGAAAGTKPAPATPAAPAPTTEKQDS
jgi:predicted negative regulator of RcsB-dependent stress response